MIDIVPICRAGEKVSQIEASLTVSIDVTGRKDESDTESKMCNGETVTQTGYSFELVLDAPSAVESDLDEEDSIDESCATEEGSLVVIALMFSFDAIFDVVKTLINGPQTTPGVTLDEVSEQRPNIDVSEYFDMDAKLLMSLASSRKKRLVQKRRANRVRAQIIVTILVSVSSVLGQWMTWSAHGTSHTPEILHEVTHYNERIGCQLTQSLES